MVNNFRFRGQYYDSETGLHYNWHRYYDPKTGRYLTADPIGLAGGINPYVYVQNDPINMIDPYGLFGVEDMPLLPDSWVDFSAGLGDALLWGFGDDLRDALGIGGVDPCSSAYRYGGWTSFAIGSSRLAYGAVAKGYSVLASSGAAASAFRSGLKNAFRLGAGKNWRPPDLSKYATDEALRAAAGRTNPYVNTYAGGVTAAGAAGGSGCGCQ